MVFVSLTSFIIGGTNLRSKEVILTHFNKVLTRFCIFGTPLPFGWVPSEFTFASRCTYAQPSHIFADCGFRPCLFAPISSPLCEHKRRYMCQKSSKILANQRKHPLTTCVCAIFVVILQAIFEDLWTRK